MGTGWVAARAEESTSSASGFRFYFWERIRQESWDNTMSLDEDTPDSTSYIRFRSSVGLQWLPRESLGFDLRLTNESRYYLAPKRDPKQDSDFTFHEVFIDQLVLNWKNPGQLPLSFSVGRQDMMMGEGFLIMDGGPLDGSRSGYFNGIRVDYVLQKEGTLIFFYVRQPRTDTVLPVMNDKEQPMVEQDEQGYGIYYSGRMNKTGLEAYLIRKDTFETDTLPEGSLNILGGRLVQPFLSKLALTTEAAIQQGSLDDEERRGLGGYFHLDYKANWSFPLPVQMILGGYYLSGDNTSTSRYEGWDAAFSRWPKWSDSFIYLQIRESRVADWSNISSIYAQLFFKPFEKTRLSLSWYRLFAPEKTASSDLLSGDGHNRGDLARLCFDHELGPDFSGRFIWEYFSPDDFYQAEADPYNWIQYQLSIRFQGDNP